MPVKLPFPWIAVAAVVRMWVRERRVWARSIFKRDSSAFASTAIAQQHVKVNVGVDHHEHQVVELVGLNCANECGFDVARDRRQLGEWMRHDRRQRRRGAPFRHDQGAERDLIVALQHNPIRIVVNERVGRTELLHRSGSSTRSRRSTTRPDTCASAAAPRPTPRPRTATTHARTAAGWRSRAPTTRCSPASRG